MIREIEVSKLENHPQNVRKSYAGIDELADSVRAKGVLQNLTVVLQPGETDRYWVVIGNRRLLAAREAGLLTVPCQVADMDEKEQASTMLLENMQREDLTIYEQAQGFQMMLDFGETEDTLSEKTGFSKTTIRHRLNIAKLDQDTLQAKEKEDGFQMTLGDLYELEKIEDIETRNKILEQAKDSRELAWRAQNAAADAKRAKRTKKITDILEKAGIERAPKSAETEQYSGKWETVQEFDLNEEPPKSIEMEETEETLYFLPYYRTVRVIRKKAKEEKVLTEEEIAKKKKDANRKEIKAKVKAMNAGRKDFVKSIIEGKIKKISDEKSVMEETWEALTACGAYIGTSHLRRFFSGKNNYEMKPEEKAEVQEKVDELSILHQMLVSLDYAMEYVGDICDYQGKYEETKGRALLLGYKVFQRYGYSFEDDECVRLLDGTHELYTREETAEDE